MGQLSKGRDYRNVVPFLMLQLYVFVHNVKEVLRFPLRGPQWDSLVENSKFKILSHFGKFEKGHISFQAHGSMDTKYPGIISFRNIKIRSLD